MRKIIYTAVAAAAIIGGSLAAATPAMAGTTPHITGSFSLASPAQYETINNVSTTGGSLSYTNFERADTAATGVWSLPTATPIALDFGLSGADYQHHLTVDSLQPTGLGSFTFTGHGTYDPDASYTWNATGSVSGTALSMHIVYTGSNAGYTVDVTGTVNPDGSVTGSATDSNGQVLSLTAPAYSAFQALSYTNAVNHVSFPTATSGQFSSAIPAGHVFGGTPYTINVTDGGSPGPGNDTYSQTPGTFYPITSGNLTVH
jgi:hypothetical protein